MNQEWKMVPISPTAEMIAAGMAVYGATARYNAMLAAAPMPPAGDVEVLGWRAFGSNFNTDEFAVEYAKWAGEVSPIVYLVDRAHVTRLQAEVSALQQRLNAADQRVDDLQTEVAKLRLGPCELIYGDELPDQGIPGTSFQRLNALANEGE